MDASARARALVLVLVLVVAGACADDSGDRPAAASTTTTSSPTSSTGDVRTTTTSGPFDVAGVTARKSSWSLGLPANPTLPVVADDLVIMGDDSGLIRAIERGGSAVWERRLSTSDDLSDVWQPVVIGDVIVTGVSMDEGSMKDGEAIGLDLATGAVRWRTPLAGRPVLNTFAFLDLRQQVLTDGVLAFVELTGFLHAIDPSTGDTRWDVELPRSLGSNEAITVVGDLVIATVGASDGVSTVAYDSSRGSEEWRAEGLWTISAARIGQVVVIEGAPARSSTAERSVVALDAASGEELWSIPLAEGGRSLGITATDDTVMRLTGERLVAYDPDTGASVWSADLETPSGRAEFSIQPLLLDDAIVVAGSQQVHFSPDPAFVRAYDLSGSPLFQWEGVGIPLGVDDTEGGGVFVTLASDDEAPPTVVALDFAQAPEPEPAEEPESVLLGIPSPREAITAENAGLAAVLLVALMVLVVLPTTLFDYALEARLDDLRARLPWNRRRRTNAPPTPATRWRRWRGLILYTALAAVIYSFLQAGWGPNTATAITAASFWAALGVITVLEIAAIWLYQAVRYRPGPLHPNVEFGTLGIAALCVAGSRAIAFVPGYVFGVVPDYKPDAAFDERDDATVEVLIAVFIFVAAVAAWFALAPLGGSVQGSRWSELPAAVCAAVFMAGVETLLIGLLPMRLLPGDIIRKHHPHLWKLLWGGSAFLFCLVLLHPGLVGASARSTVWILVIAAAYGSCAVAVWALIARRPPGHAEDTSDPAPLATQRSQ